jgi:hypothetical protein
MIISAGCFTMVRPAILALALLITAGCAAAPPQAASSAPATGAQAAVYDETPASQTDLVESAEFALSARREGLKPQVRNGVVVYCWTDQDIGSRLPTKKCVNQTQAQILIQQREAQREAVQRVTGGACTAGLNCGH